MAIVKTLARDWTFTINTGSVAVPTWTTINGINSHSWSITKNDADTTTYDDEGWLSHLPASRGKSVTLSGIYMEDPSNGDRDPGQEACETASELIGPDGLKQFKITSPGSTTITGLGSVQVTSGGGGNDDPGGWEAVVTFSGKPTIS